MIEVHFAFPLSDTEMSMITEQLKSYIAKRMETETRYAIAKGAGVKFSTLSRFIEEGRDIRASTIDALADYLGLELRSKAKQPAETVIKRPKRKK